VISSAVLTVFAAASLTNVLPRIDTKPTYSFAGSNALAAQIRREAPADVFASANTAIPQQLYAEDIVEKPVVFTRNALILIVPKSKPARIHKVALGEADAGFVYTTDVLSSPHVEAARTYVAKLLRPSAQAKPRVAGFLAKR
jgi:ABC-type molybdate transport system substrate-binding protein